MILITGFFILIIAIFIVLFLLTKKILKTLMLGILLTFVIFGVLGFLIFRDVKDLIGNFSDSKNKMLFVLDDKIIGGMTIKGFGFEEQEQSKNLPLLVSDQINNLNQDYPKNLDNILGDDYKLLIVDTNMIEKLEFISEEDNNFPENGKEALEIIKQNDSLKYYFESYLPSKGFTKSEIGMIKRQLSSKEETTLIFKNSDNFRSFIATFYFIKLAESDTNYIIDGFGNGNIKIYPETITIRIMREVPSTLSKFISREE